MPHPHDLDEVQVSRLVSAMVHCQSPSTIMEVGAPRVQHLVTMPVNPHHLEYIIPLIILQTKIRFEKKMG